MRKSDHLLLLYMVLLGLFLLSMLDTARFSHQEGEHIGRARQIVGELGLTDPALFTEASYTRNLTQADLDSAFQDHPMALEHFPSGSMLLPPQRQERH